MKNYLHHLLYILPIPLILLGLNYFVDPANLFRSDYESGIANYLLSGNHVTNVINYNERILQKLFIEKMERCPTTIVLGSSRIMQISSFNTKDSLLINDGVSGATLEDFVSIYYLYEKKGYHLKKVILGLDPWMLNDNHEQDRWKSLAAEYNTFSSKLLGRKNENANAFNFYKLTILKELWSFSYFKSSLQYAVNGIHVQYIPTHSIVNDGFTRLMDGSISYDKAFRSVSLTEIDARAKSNMAGKTIYSLGNYTHFSEKYLVLLDKFVLYLQNQNTEVQFFLSPYHPLIYEHFSRSNYYSIVIKTENYFRNYAAEHHIKIMGSYNPAKYNFDHSWFYDGLHCKETAIEEILKREN
ncbi:MAG: hypothetical protein ABI772_05220 [Bacteroidota bacterium]